MPLIKEFSIQLYSLREQMKDDFKGVVRRLAGLGYTGVEFAGYGGLSAAEMRSLLGECGLKSVGSHVGYDDIVNNCANVIEYNKTIGSEFIVCPYAQIRNRDEALRAAEALSKPAEEIAKAGMGFAYHNHHEEFLKDGGEFALDIFYGNTDPKIVSAELDLYWAAFAGVDPLEYMRGLKGRVKLLHVKQMRDYETKKCVDLNEGVIDFKEVLKAGNGSGVLHYILEQEEFEVDPWLSVKNGIDHILSL
jgi:sugar phosphate isomerase/epimerase